MRANERDSEQGINLEMRRGALTLGVLSALRSEHYGYSLRQTLAAARLEIEESTLYPLLRRLEDQGLLVSRWSEVNGRERRYYRLSAVGQRVLNAVGAEWRALSASVESLLGRST
jgi:DNA-binding PadR family transcriptional regulator